MWSKAVVLATFCVLSAAETSISPWQVVFKTGTACQGSSSVTSLGSSSLTAEGGACLPLPSKLRARSLTFGAADDESTYILSTHLTPDCSDNNKVFQAAGHETCVPIDGASFYKVSTIPQLNTSSLERRQMAPRNIELSISTIGTSGLAYMAIQQAITACATMRADPNDYKDGSCGVAITGSVLFSAGTVWAFTVSVRQAGQVPGRRDEHADMTAGQVFARAVQPTHHFYNERNGYNTTVVRLPAKRGEEESGWVSYHLNHTNYATGHNHAAQLHHHADTGRLRAAASEEIHNSLLGKRQNIETWTAIYSWIDGVDTNPLDGSDQQTSRLTASAYNFGSDNVVPQYCATVVGTDEFGQGISYNRANLALIEGDGSNFVDYAGSC